MKHQHKSVTHRVLAAFAVGTMALATACTMKSQEAPPLTGPSEFGTSVTISVSPDVLTQDGASQSLVTIIARDSNGAPLRNVSLRAEISVGGVRADFGTLSARNLVTDNSGRATLVYTAPTSGSSMGVDSWTVVDILVTPVGTDFNNSTPRTASIRLVPPGIIVPPDGLAPYFTFTPAAPTDHQLVLFTACGDPLRACAPPNNPIASYAWDYGDGGTGSGQTSTHSYNTPGTYFAKLTVSDSIGRSASTTQPIVVAPGALPAAAFEFSPTAPRVGDSVSFNASTSTTSVPGSRIVSYTWDFGDGTPQVTTANVVTFHTFLSAKTFKVILTVTDNSGRTSIGTPKDVPIVP